MKPNKYSKDFVDRIRVLSATHTFNELLIYAQKEYDINKIKMQKLLYRYEIHTIDYKPQKNHARQCEIGTEWKRKDGMIMIKVDNKNWVYKQRYIYQNYYNVKLDSKTMIIFLDNDRTNFDINNLMTVSTPEYNCIKNKHLITGNAELTRTAILSARLNYLGEKDD